MLFIVHKRLGVKQKKIIRITIGATHAQSSASPGPPHFKRSGHATVLGVCFSFYKCVSSAPEQPSFVELHVLFVPCDQWNVKLNKISAKATESFISAGFIRVYPDITLRTLRAELAAFLGGEKDVNKFSFLRCVGQSLAVVKSSQEKDLKVKTFAPPYAAQPELYLLPAVEADSSFCSRSVTTDTSSSSPEQQICYQPLKLNSKDVHALTSLRNKPTAGVCGGLDSVKPASPVTNSKLCSHAQDLMLLLLITTNVLFLKGEELIETLKLVKEERRELEWTRQQLLRKGKDLLSQNRHRRNQARDSWKKKYFGTKKATAPLEDKLRQLKLELETLYNKALHQLQIRKSLGKPLRQGRTSGKVQSNRVFIRF
uniref:Spermatosis associated 1 n=1 Tax=Nothobranchius furzeri TaxID=105023 RepID=A0A8C6Q702_NOTFU